MFLLNALYICSQGSICIECILIIVLNLFDQIFDFFVFERRFHSLGYGRIAVGIIHDFQAAVFFRVEIILGRVWLIPRYLHLLLTNVMYVPSLGPLIV